MGAANWTPFSRRRRTLSNEPEGSNSRLTQQAAGTANAIVSATSLSDVQVTIQSMSDNFTEHIKESNEQLAILAATNAKTLPVIAAVLQEERAEQKRAQKQERRRTIISVVGWVITTIIAIIAIGVAIALAQ